MAEINVTVEEVNNTTNVTTSPIITTLEINNTIVSNTIQNTVEPNNNSITIEIEENNPIVNISVIENGVSDSVYEINPQFTYTSGKITRIDYSSGWWKEFTYSGDQIIQLDYHQTNKIKRKVFTYNTDGTLDYITETEI